MVTNLSDVYIEPNNQTACCWLGPYEKHILQHRQLKTNRQEKNSYNENPGQNVYMILSLSHHRSLMYYSIHGDNYNLVLY